MSSQEKDGATAEEAFEFAVCTLPEAVLLQIGGKICQDAPAVRFYHAPDRPRYFENQAELKRTIRTTWKQGAAAQRQEMLEILSHHRECRVKD